MKKFSNNQGGQTLVILLCFMIIAVVITSAAIFMVLNSASGTSKVQQGITAYGVAESGAENGIISFIRNRNYTGETLSVGDGQAVITLTGTNPKTMTVVGTLNNLSRTIRVTLDTTGGIVSVTSWEEI